MRLIEPCYNIVTDIDRDNFYKLCEIPARKCYQSENRIAEGSAEKLIKILVKHRHEAMLEHCPNIQVNFICDRAFSHELVRHRLCSFAQESQRYVKYENNDMEFIIPYWLDKFKCSVIPQETVKANTFLEACETAERKYKMLRQLGLRPEDARGVLPNAVKTEITVTTNIREWRHLLKLRTANDAHPDMQRIMRPLLLGFINYLPAFFEDINHDWISTTAKGE